MDVPGGWLDNNITQDSTLTFAHVRPLRSNEIRLLRILDGKEDRLSRCQITYHDISDNPAYVALSYA